MTLQYHIEEKRKHKQTQQGIQWKANVTRLEEMVQIAPEEDRERMRRSSETELWLTSLPNYRTGTELVRKEFQDDLLHRCGMPPVNLPTTCGGCR